MANPSRAGIRFAYVAASVTLFRMVGFFRIEPPGVEMQDQEEAQQSIRSTADLEQLIRRGGNGRHWLLIDRYGNVP